MQANLRKLTALITILAALFSIGLACHPNPTEPQTALANSANIIMVKGAIALFSLQGDRTDE